jgi:predicted kinase
MPLAFAFRGPMTAKRRFKRRVRERARKTGESYTTALAHVRHRPEQEQSMTDHVSDAHNELSGTASGPVIIVSGAAGVGKSTVSRMIAAAFDRSVHLNTDDFMASVVSGWVDPNLPGAEQQNEAVGAAFAVSAMSFAEDGYTTVVDGYLFPDGVNGLAAACAARGLSCHYVVLTADLDTCWARASSRGEGRWLLEFQPFAAVHEKFGALDLNARHRVEATGSPVTVRDAVLSAFRAGRLVVTEQPAAP